MANEPITREEILLNAVATGEAANLEPITREEMFLAKLGGADVTAPTPITRKEQFLQKAIENGGNTGGSAPAVVELLTVTENGTYTAPNGVDGYNPVSVDVPIPDGYIVPSGTKEITENGEHDVTEYASVSVKVEGAGDPEMEEQFIRAIERGGRAVTELPSGTTKIGENAFYYCTNLALTSLPSGVTSIGEYAFYYCTNLALTSLPSGVTSIGEYAFYYCTNLALTSLPSGVTSIDEYAFYLCKNLTEITFKGKPSTIKNNAFNGCFFLETINVPWAEGEVSGAPWGATNATINYNYTGG